MKKFKSIYIILQLLCIAAIILQSCSRNAINENVSIDNGKMLLSFDKKSGALVEFHDMADLSVYYDTAMPSFSPWEVELIDSSGTQVIDINDAAKFNYRKPSDTTLILEWKEFHDLKNKNFRISAIVSLSEKEPMSSWHISLHGTSGLQVNKLAFPRIKISETEGDEYLAVPEWMGQVIRNPRDHLSAMKTSVMKYEWSYPGPLSLQCAALYTTGK